MADTDERSELLAELDSACVRNPHKSLTQIVMRAAAHSAAFSPEDASDAELLHGLRNLGVRPPRIAG